jgi:hypothetical protein
VLTLAQCCFHEIGDLMFVVGLTGNIDKRGSEVDDVR